MTVAYPLQWPFGRPKTSYPARSRFGERSIEKCTSMLRAEINRLGGSGLVISSNLRLRQDGYPYSNQRQPDDKGIAVYFTYKGKQMCFACDRWDRVEDNIYAVSMTIDALRGIERWGSGDMVQQAFTGFEALPAPDDPHTILGIRRGATESEIDAAYRQKAKEAHPDKPGGSVHSMAKLNEARDRLKEAAHG